MDDDKKMDLNNISRYQTEIFKKAREILHITQREAADILKTSYSTYQRIEYGSKKLEYEDIDEDLHMMGLTLNEDAQVVKEKFLETPGNKNSTEDEKNKDISKDTKYERDDMHLIASRIRKLRKEKGYTQTELGRMTGLTQGMITQLELCKTDITYNTAVKISEALDVSTRFILCGDLVSRDYPVNREMIEFLEQNPEVRKKIYEEMR